MKLTINSYYDNQNGDYIATKFYIDGQECSEEEYCEMVDSLNDASNENVDVNENDECDCMECTLDRFSEQIQEITGGCFGCIREVLQDFLCEIVEHIVIEDVSENECLN